MKQLSTIRKRKVLFLVLLASVLLAVAVFLTVSSIAKREFWKGPHLQSAVIDITEYNDSIDLNDSALNDIETRVITCNKEAVPITGTVLSFIESCNDAIIRCFQDIYGVDVSEKLEALHVMRASYPEDISQMVGGSYYGDTPEMSERLFLNASIVDAFEADVNEDETPMVTDNTFSVKMLRTVYIHEAIHYIGVTGDEVFNHFFEALTESLNKKVMLYNGIEYESITGYNSIQGFAEQIIECDSELVRQILTDDSFCANEYFDKMLGGNYATYFDALIGLIKNGESRDIGKLSFYAQYMTYEYCKVVDANAERTLGDACKSTVAMFELKWFLADR